MTKQWTADDIVRLPPIEAIRNRPEMYIRDIGPTGINRMILALVLDTLDLHIAGACTTLTIDTSLPIRVGDDGPGFPDGTVEDCATQIHVGSPRPGVRPPSNALVVVNALSTALTVESCADGLCQRWRFVEHELVEASSHRCRRADRITRVCFWPDPSVLQASDPDHRRLLELLATLPGLLANLRIYLDGQRLTSEQLLPRASQH